MRSEEYKAAKKHLRAVTRELSRAATLTAGVNFTDEEREFLLADHQRLLETLELLNKVLHGARGVEVDFELADIEERYQWGPGGRPNDVPLPEPWKDVVARAGEKLRRRLGRGGAS